MCRDLPFKLHIHLYLLENWDKYIGGAKSREYFDKFWIPKSKDFARGEAKAESGGKQ